MKKLFFLGLLAITGCIETDIIEDEIIVINIAPDNSMETVDAVSLLINEKMTFQLTATSDRGGEFIAQGTWASTNPNVATINENGEVTAIGEGSTEITASKFGLNSNPIMVSVVDNLNDVALIKIEAPGNSASIEVGQTLQLSAKALNVVDNVLGGITIEWSSDNTSVATVDDNGLVSALSNGSVNIKASGEGKIGIFSLTIGKVEARSGMFQGKGSYNASGTGTLSKTASGNLSLDISSDFSSSSGPGLYLYLSNQDNSISGGVELGPLRKNSGADTYSVPGGIALEDYNYILIYCKPFGVHFGFAELN